MVHRQTSIFDLPGIFHLPLNVTKKFIEILYKFLYNKTPNSSNGLYSYEVYYIIMSSQLNHIVQWISISVEQYT